MTLAPLLAAPLAVKIHVAAVLPAFLLGTWQIFLSAKGARPHRAVGYLYLGLMTVTAITSLFIHMVMPGGPFWGFSPVHLFIPLTLYGVVGGLYYAHRGDIVRHKRVMIRTYVGALLIAGGFTLVPGRIMHAVLFGH
jgi:uncharacterized membrane protein